MDSLIFVSKLLINYIERNPNIFVENCAFAVLRLTNPVPGSYKPLLRGTIQLSNFYYFNFWTRLGVLNINNITDVFHINDITDVEMKLN